MTSILVIEDDDSLRQEIVSNLQFDGYHVWQAADGLAGVALTREHLPDLVLCDIMMPKLDGYGVLLECRARKATAAIPFIFLTAKADRSDIRYGMELGADDYILKPFRFAQLRQAIRTRLEKRAVIDQIYQTTIDQLRRNLINEHAQFLAKSQFLSMVAHDLKTPLTNILSAAELIKHYEDRLGPERKREKLDLIESAVQEMMCLIDDLLVLGRTETDVVKIQPEPLDIVGLCSEVIASIQHSTGETHQINLCLADDLVTHMTADRKILKRVFSNLLDNAIKYSPARSNVALTIAGSGDEVVITIADEGIGIPQADLTNLFALFQRSSNVGTIPGSGIGLTIVKRGVDLHGGTITFESTPGQGTIFVVKLPRHTEPKPAHDGLSLNFEESA